MDLRILDGGRMSLRILQGDVIERLRELTAGSVHCVVTSPPYWGLRDYGVAGQIGLEATFDQWLGRMVEVFAEVKRVLRDDGTVWLNIGDSYETAGGAGNQGQQGDRVTRTHTQRRIKAIRSAGLKPKDLIGMPWRLAFALQADGWFLRSDIIWHKPNPTPESVTDRPTKSHDYVFLLSKSARYFYDAEAVKEQSVSGHASGNGFAGRQGGSERVGPQSGGPGTDEEWNDIGGQRNLRSVWTIGTQAYPGAHFATFPEALVERCIAAGTSEKGCCAGCGRPWRRIVDRQRVRTRPGENGKCFDRRNGQELADNDKPWASEEVGNRDPGRHVTATATVGWSCACQCDAPESPTGTLQPVPCTVLDPFLGSGTTAEVALKMGRAAIGIELNPEYCRQARERLGLLSMMEKRSEETLNAERLIQRGSSADCADYAD